MGILFTGLIAGFGSAFLGIGGGVVIVPALVIFFKFDIKKAVGTSLAAIVPSALVGASLHYLINPDNIFFGVAAIIAVGAVIGAKLGALTANRIHSRLLTVLFACLLLVVGLKQGRLLPWDEFLSPLEAANFIPHYFALGLFAGFSSALFGIGGGVIIVPALSLLFSFGMHQAIPTSLTVIVPTTFFGAIFHYQKGSINLNVLKFLVPGALAGAVMGAFISNWVTGDVLRNIFAVLLIVFSVKLFSSILFKRIGERDEKSH